jgi:hypothetical protein
VSLYVVLLQLEREFLFQVTTRDTIMGILRSLYIDLVNSGEAFLDLDPSNVIAVKLIRQPRIPIIVNDYEVPILYANTGSSGNMVDNYQNSHNKFLLAQLPWDISVRHLLNVIDGVSYVKKLAHKSEASMDVDIVKRCLRILMHYNCVIMSDVLRFTNIYQLTPAGREFIIALSAGNHPANTACFSLFNELINFCVSASSRLTTAPAPTRTPVEAPLTGATNRSSFPINKGTPDIVGGGSTPGSAITPITPATSSTPTQLRSVTGPTPTNIYPFAPSQTHMMRLYIRCIQRFLCALQPGRMLSAVLEILGKDFKWHGINIRRLLAFCQNRGLIRRVHEYPVDMYTSVQLSGNGAFANLFTGAGSDNHSATSSHSEGPPNDDVLSGLHSMDAICTAQSLDPAVITDMGGICIILK